jgi:hypothetical protein
MSLWAADDAKGTLDGFKPEKPRDRHALFWLDNPITPKQLARRKASWLDRR